MYAGVPVARATIGLHDNRCPHSSLDGKPPDQAYSSMPMPDGSEAAAAKKPPGKRPQSVQTNRAASPESVG